MPRRACAILLATFLLFPVSVSVAQSGESLFSNRTLNYLGLSIVNDPGQYAMGGGTVALRGRPGAVDVNPAAIGREGFVESGIDLGVDPFLQSDFIFDQTLMSPFVTVRSGRWAAGLQFIQFSYGTFEQRSGDGRVLETIDKRHRTIKAFGAYDLTDTWTAGAAIGYSAEGFAQLDVDDARSVTLDLGIYGEWERTLSSGGQWRPSVGLSLTDFGPNSTIVEGGSPSGGRIGDVEVATPTRLHLGGALVYESGAKPYGRPAVVLTGHLGLAKEMVRLENSGTGGIDAANPFAALVQSWKPADTEIFLDGDGVRQVTTVGAWGQIVKHVGVEVTALDLVSLRLGRKIADETFEVNTTAAGLGVDLVYLRLDYAITLTSSVDEWEDLSYVRLTARLPIDGRFDRHWW
ncbi:hypothetical protein [Longibacter sp.]|jgi:hypothetical protein|uniref:hypothetical protein n=1 Tax=Longibacter sp. TaxID=2045415 RepID=UPI003EB82084